MKIGIIAAMDSERKQLEKLLKDNIHIDKGLFSYIEGKIGKNTAILVQCGIGKVNAAVGTVELINQFHPDCIISTGVAGGIDAGLELMDVVAANKTVYHDVWCGEGNVYGQIQGLPAYLPVNSTLYQCALSLPKENHVKGGLICSGDKFISERKELDDIKRHFPEGLAVDMESGAIAQVCYLYKVPFISFRIISDTPNKESKARFQEYLDFWGEMANRSFKVTEKFLEALPETL